MNDFLKGYSQGMTGSTSGLPSQSVLEAMGRDAARNQWNNNNHSSGNYTQGHTSQDNVIPITSVLYEAGKKMRFKKLLRDALIAIALSIVPFVIDMLLPQGSALKWATGIISLIGALMLLWVVLRLPIYLIARIGSVFEGKGKNKSDAP